MKHTVLLLSAALTALSAGCTSNKAAHSSGDDLLAAQGPTPYLLFDRLAGPTDAAAMSARAPWPTVDIGTQVREYVLFDERFLDYQGGQRNIETSFQRRFTTRRIGYVER